MKLTNREKDIYNIITKRTTQALSTHNYLELGYDAFNLSYDLHLDRANISRILNKLARNGMLSKIIGRPLSYISKESSNAFFPNVYCPNVFSSLKEATTFFLNATDLNVNADNSFSTLIGTYKNESLHVAISQLKSAVVYPPHGISCALYGKIGTGKHVLIQRLFDYAVSLNIFNDAHCLINIECSSLKSDTSLLTLFSSSPDNSQMVVFHNCEHLSVNQINELSNLINKVLLNSAIPLFIVLTYADSSINNIPVPVIIRLPDFNERTLKERLILILKLLKEESKRIGKSLSINKNTLNCLVISNYADNILSIKREIQHSISTTLINQTSNIIEISFNSLSDDLLSNIDAINSHTDELHSIYNYIELDNITISPHDDNRLINYLKRNIMYQDNGLVHQNNKLLSPHDNDDIYQLAKSRIKEALAVPFTMLNTNTISEIYSALLPVLSNHSLSTNDKLLHGFLWHINNWINGQCASNDFSYNDKHLLNNEQMTRDIQVILTDKYNITIQLKDLIFLDHYLTMAEAITRQARIRVYFTSRNNMIGETYTLFANSFCKDNKALNLNLLNLEIKNDEDIKQLDDGKGVLLLCDENIPNHIQKRFTDNCNALLLVENINMHSLPKIMQLTDKEDTFIEDLSFINNVPNLYNRDNAEQDILSIIEIDILTPTLTFLNPIKIISLAKDSLDVILDKLSISCTDVILFKFIANVAFMVERLIKDEPLNYKKINEYYKKHSELIHIIEESLINIKDQFGIIIPQSELIYIAELFTNND